MSEKIRSTTIHSKNKIEAAQLQMVSQDALPFADDIPFDLGELVSDLSEPDTAWPLASMETLLVNGGEAPLADQSVWVSDASGGSYSAEAVAQTEGKVIVAEEVSLENALNAEANAGAPLWNPWWLSSLLPLGAAALVLNHNREQNQDDSVQPQFALQPSIGGQPAADAAVPTDSESVQPQVEEELVAEEVTPMPTETEAPVAEKPTIENEKPVVEENQPQPVVETEQPSVPPVQETPKPISQVVEQAETVPEADKPSEEEVSKPPVIETPVAEKPAIENDTPVVEENQPQPVVETEQPSELPVQETPKPISQVAEQAETVPEADKPSDEVVSTPPVIDAPAAEKPALENETPVVEENQPQPVVETEQPSVPPVQETPKPINQVAEPAETVPEADKPSEEVAAPAPVVEKPVAESPVTENVVSAAEEEINKHTVAEAVDKTEQAVEAPPQKTPQEPDDVGVQGATNTAPLTETPSTEGNTTTPVIKNPFESSVTETAVKPAPAEAESPIVVPQPPVTQPAVENAAEEGVVTADTVVDSQDDKAEVPVSPIPTPIPTPTPIHTVDSVTPVETSAPVLAGRAGHYGDYRIHYSHKYGDYINVTDFGADPTGKTDSLAAIQAALAAAHKEKATVHLSGTFYISDQIVIDEHTAGVRGLVGDGMGKTVIRFDKAQEGIFNPDTNHDDIRAYAGILIDGQNHKTIADLSVEYTNPDFYRTDMTYFGKVNGIMVNDADHTLINRVEVSGVNRAGVFFTSTATLTKEAGYASSYKARVINGEIDETYGNLPLGENNRIIDSYLHHNRVAGALVGYQKNFIAEGNTLSWNGHEADGGTGYGIAAMAGSYNYGITYRGNTTDHNYRKGLDVHDGTDIVIENNVLNGDRLYGIAVYNRQFSMDNVKITGNTITQDDTFRLAVDDTQGMKYHVYSGIQLQTNTQYRDLHSADTGYFEISGNTIKNLTLYKNEIQTYGIEFRNYETKMKYTLNITDNHISGESTKYLIGVINDTQNPTTGASGIGSGNILISSNKMDIGTIANGAVPVLVQEKNSTQIDLHGSVTLDSNELTIRDAPSGYSEFAYLWGNAASYHVTNNLLNLRGKLNDPMVVVHGTGNGKDTVDAYIAQNAINTDISGKLYASWVRPVDAEVFADANHHNGDALSFMNTGKMQQITLDDVMSSVNQVIATASTASYATQASLSSMTDNMNMATVGLM